MRTVSATLALLALLTFGTIAQAGVIGVAADDGDGALACTGAWTPNPLWDPEHPEAEDAGDMAIVGDQNWGPGHVGSLALDNTAYFEINQDPTVKLRTTIENDTGFSWTGYFVNVYMDQPFTLTVPTVYTPDTSEPGWGVASYVSTAVPVSGHWEANVNFAGGTPIPDGGTLDFSYKLTFTGTVHYCQEMTPVPEPSTIVLVLNGLAGLVFVRRRFAR
jgi:hypothetical protein